MSILCLICKEKLISYSHQGDQAGSLNQLKVENVIATICGHLYHLDCLQSWFQNIKKQNINDNDNNICPSCLTRVKEDENRRIHLLEDHVESLDRAKMLERHDNLEIYCHQLEIQLQQLHRENDMMVNKILTPPFNSPLEDYDTIVKNDRVQWIRKDEPAVAGIVLSIFKKEGKLCAKIRLDRKIRTTQRSNRIFSSFRSEKKQEVTVPFEEIVLEKDVNENKLRGPQSPNLVPNQMNAYGRSISSTNLFPLFSNPTTSFRNSTSSLPDVPRRLFGIQESINESSTSINMEQPNYSLAASTKRPSLNRSISYSPGYSSTGNSNVNRDVVSQIKREPVPVSTQSQSTTSSDASLDQQREYVVITPPWMRNKQQAKQPETKNSPPDCKNKHVTFADDHNSCTRFSFEGQAGSPFPKVPEGRESLSSLNSDTPYVNFPSPLPSNGNVARELMIKPSTHSPPPVHPRPKITIPQSKIFKKIIPESTYEESYSGTDSNSLPATPTSPTPPPYESRKMPVLQYPQTNESNLSITDEFKVLLEDFVDDDLSPATDNSDCFAVTLLALLYSPNGFDQQMMADNYQDNEFCRTVKWIIREKFIFPLRQFNVVQPDYAILLKESLVHLCSGTLDVEELITVLFEFTYKAYPFINYSLEMCDYIHQFFIDFTDKVKVRTVRELFEKSLLLQDNLLMENIPSPALILQMPHSEDGIIHYEAVIPNLTMSIDQLVEKGGGSTFKTCYCNNEATLECKICTEIHGADTVLFCDKCKDLLQGIHKSHDHELEMSPIPKLHIPTETLSLSAIICWKGGRYYIFLKDGRETYSEWLYVHTITDGKLQIKQLPAFGYWLDSLEDSRNTLKIQDVPLLLQKVLKYSRVFFYIPVRSSEV